MHFNLEEILALRSLPERLPEVLNALRAGHRFVVIHDDQPVAVLSGLPSAVRATAARPDAAEPHLEQWDAVDKGQAVRDTARRLLDRQGSFAQREVIHDLHSMYEGVNDSTVRIYVIRDTVDHKSRRHYPGGEDLWRKREDGRLVAANMFHEHESLDKRPGNG